MNATDWPLYAYRGEVTRVIDGDTLDVLLDLGLYTSRRVRVRLLGYDAPERFSGSQRVAGAQWRDWLITLLAAHGNRVYLRTERDHTSFDRYLAHVFVAEGDGTLVNVAQVATGSPPK